MMDYLVGYDADETEIWRYGGDKGQEDEKAKKVANNCLKCMQSFQFLSHLQLFLASTIAKFLAFATPCSW